MLLRRLNSIGSSSSRPASIFEMSRMSLRSVSSESADPLSASRYSRCSRVSVVSSTSSVMPITPFIGVRISWLMFARNSLFDRLAASASSFAAFSSTSAQLPLRHVEHEHDHADRLAASLP